MTDPQPPAQKPSEAKPAPASAAQPAASGSATKAILTNIPIVLTAIGGVIAAIATLISSADKAGWLRHPTPTLAPIVAAATAPPPSATFTIAPTEAPPAATVTVAPTQAPATATPTSALPEGALLMDDFGDSTQSWEVGSDDSHAIAYQDGEYRIVVREIDATVWGSPTKGYDLTDFALEVDARQAQGSEDAYYGVVVRIQPEARFYMFGVSSDGTFGVQRLEGDIWSDLHPWSESNSVRPLGQVNHLRVECLGQRMRFYVNDELLAEVADAALASGNIGLVAGTVSEGEIEMRFDNVRVQVLKKL